MICVHCDEQYKNDMCEGNLSKNHLSQHYSLKNTFFAKLPSSRISNMATRVATALFGLLAVTSGVSAQMANCSGSATYDVKFFNFLSAAKFGDLIPEDGLVFGAPAGASHSNRVSILTVRGFASEAIEAVAEKGNSSLLVEAVTALRDSNEGVKTVIEGADLVLPGNSTTLQFDVDCEHPFISAVAMIAPSPDWFIAIANRDMTDSRGQFIKEKWGKFIAFDAGTDNGREFTDPSDLSLDMPTTPPLNIAPLVEDETDRFEGRVVGAYVMKLVSEN